MNFISAEYTDLGYMTRSQICAEILSLNEKDVFYTTKQSGLQYSAYFVEVLIYDQFKSSWLVILFILLCGI